MLFHLFSRFVLPRYMPAKRVVFTHVCITQENTKLARRKSKRTSNLKERDLDDIFIKELCYARMEAEIKDHLLKKEEYKRWSFLQVNIIEVSPLYCIPHELPQYFLFLISFLCTVRLLFNAENNAENLDGRQLIGCYIKGSSGSTLFDQCLSLW